MSRTKQASRIDVSEQTALRWVDRAVMAYLRSLRLGNTASDAIDYARDVARQGLRRASSGKRRGRSPRARA
jgi:hypothetical protein